jgi:hypothetical protein
MSATAERIAEISGFSRPYIYACDIDWVFEKMTDTEILALLAAKLGKQGKMLAVVEVGKYIGGEGYFEANSDADLSPLIVYGGTKNLYGNVTPPIPVKPNEV